MKHLETFSSVCEGVCVYACVCVCMRVLHEWVLESKGMPTVS